MGISRISITAGISIAIVALVGCGGAKKSAATQPASTTSTPPPSAPTSSRAAKPPPASALRAEATASAAGDIPDNQVFLVFRNAAAGYSMKYPEGWAQSGRAGNVTFSDKNNIVRVVVVNGSPPTVAGVRRQLATLRGAHVQSGPKAMTVGGKPAVRVVYTTESPQNPVTGKRVTLVVDRYYLAHGGKEAIVDLGTPQGVDNVDAYRLMIESFQWK